MRIFLFFCLQKGPSFSPSSPAVPSFLSVKELVEFL
jgi:hypothetical protein